MSHNVSESRILHASGVTVCPLCCWSTLEIIAVDILFSACVGELLGESRALTEGRTLPVDDVDRGDEDEGDNCEDSGGPGEMVLSADVCWGVSL